MEDTIRKYALHNAVLHKGKANQGAVIGKVIAEHPEAKKDMKSLAMNVGKILKDINSMNPDDQLAQLQELAPELLEKKEKEERDIFAFLKLEDKPYTTLFPTGPEKYPHLGHAKSCYLNYLLSKKTGGKFYIRYDDTNPKLVEEKYYDIMKKDLEWFGVEFDDVVYASDFMDLYYEKAEQLITDGLAYVDASSPEEVKTSREKGIPTMHRDNSVEENLSMWKSLFSDAKEGAATVRLKIDLKHQNTTMRDPTIFRIIDAPHPRTGEKYRVWPTYDIQTAIMDGHSKIEFRLRSKEFEMRAELQRWIQDKCGMPLTSTYEFARFNMEGVKSSGRIIREGIEKGELLGWDDPSLTTLAALRRRGFTAQSLQQFVLSTGITKAEATFTWDDVISQNKKIIDKEANRYFFVADPVNVTIEGAPEQNISLKLYPAEDRGTRDHAVKDEFYLAQEDVDTLEDGSLYRLMDCLNFRKEGDKFTFVSTSVDDFKKEGKKIMHWLPAEGNVEAEVMKSDKTVSKGLAEKDAGSLKNGQRIQFERFGFCIVDDAEKNVFWLTHK